MTKRSLNHESDNLYSSWQEGMELLDGDRVAMRRSPHPVDIIASPLRTRFQILQAKLRWGER